MREAKQIVKEARARSRKDASDQITNKAKGKAKKELESAKWIIQKLWDSYSEGRTIGKSLDTDKSRYGGVLVQ